MPITRSTDAEVQNALQVLQAFWGGVAGKSANEVAEVCRLLTLEELKLVRAWIPAGAQGSPTATRCARAREIVSGVIAEKDRK